MHRSILVLALVALAATSAWAQVPVAADHRVRLTLTDGSQMVGVVSSISADSIAIAQDGSERRAFSLGHLVEIERSMGRHRRMGRNLALTVGVTSVGLATAFAIGHPEGRSEAFAWGLLSGAALGVPLGLVVGLTIKHEQWLPVSGSGEPEATLSVGPVLGPQLGAGVSVGLRW
jgi:hypothetical protein